LRAGNHGHEHTVPAKGQRAKVQNKEDIGDEFGEAWENAKGERGSWGGIGSGEAESGLSGVNEGKIRRHECSGRA
jgi:phage-related tail fiber protein